MDILKGSPSTPLSPTSSLFSMSPGIIGNNAEKAHIGAFFQTCKVKQQQKERIPLNCGGLITAMQIY